MSLLTCSPTIAPACSHTTHRPLGGVSGLREVADDVSRIKVSALPFAMIREASLTREAIPGCYILADHATAYIGETGNLARRLAGHAADPAKSFAREVYVVSGHPAPWPDKTAAIYLQHRLTLMAEQASLVEVMRGIRPFVSSQLTDFFNTIRQEWTFSELRIAREVLGAEETAIASIRAFSPTTRVLSAG